MSPGRVILVGAGPGDPDLLTLRGAAVLGRADVVLYDQLVDESLLAFAAKDAELINVGKRGHDAPTRSQDDVNALLVRHALAGKTVVRLKGGDSFVFGRGGEEASHCAAAGIDFEVVPGVSSALAVPAHAGIPVTDRRYAASFAVVTGHKDPTRVSENTRWEALANAVDTLVILMGMKNLPSLVARVLSAGRPGDTPAAAIMWGTTPRQQTVTAPLSELPKRVEEAGLGAPSVVVIGDVVRLREELAWFERAPLFGRRVLVTRPASQAAPLLSAIRALGGEPVAIPTLEIEPPSDPLALEEALARLDDYEAVVFASTNAVEAFATAAKRQGVRVDGVTAACIGERTARAAARIGVSVRAVPAVSVAEGLAEEILRVLPAAGRRLLVPRSEIARGALPRDLRSGGALVDDPVAYRAVAPEGNAEALRAELASGTLDALTFTSPSTVRNFLAMLDEPAREAAGHCARVAIGPTTAAALEAAGLDAAAVAEQPEAGALARAVASALHSGSQVRGRVGRQEAP